MVLGVDSSIQKSITCIAIAFPIYSSVAIWNVQCMKVKREIKLIHTFKIYAVFIENRKKIKDVITFLYPIRFYCVPIYWVDLMLRFNN